MSATTVLRVVSVSLAIGAVAFVGVAAGAGATTATAYSARHDLFGPVRPDLSNWGGYAASGTAGEFTTAAADWTIPTVTCLAKHDLYAPWVGIDGYNDSTVEQTGVQTSCKTGSPVESAWYEMYPALPVYFSNSVSAGDAIAASVTYAGGTFTLKISDTTQGWTQTVQKALAGAQRGSAEAVIEAPGGYPQISSVKFTHVLLNGADLSTFSPVKLRTGSGGTVYVPGAIVNGTNFTIKPKA